MHCELHAGIVYTQFSNVIRRQKEIIKELVLQRQQETQKIHPGISCFRGATLESIGLREINGKAFRALKQIKSSESEEDLEKLTMQLSSVLNSIVKSSSSWPFLQVRQFICAIKSVFNKNLL